MIWLPDSTVEHLVAVAGWPEFTSDRYEVHRGDRPRRHGHRVRGVRPRARPRGRDQDWQRAAVDRAPGQADARGESASPGSSIPASCPCTTSALLADGRPFYVMKRVHGRTLQACLEQAPPLAERLRIFERVCEAVSFAHAHEHHSSRPEAAERHGGGVRRGHGDGLGRRAPARRSRRTAAGQHSGVRPDEHPQVTRCRNRARHARIHGARAGGAAAGHRSSAPTSTRWAPCCSRCSPADGRRPTPSLRSAI